MSRLNCLPLLLASASLVGALEVSVSPEDMGWKSSVEMALPGTTISFLPGLYQSCNVAIPAGVTLTAKYNSTEAKVIIDCNNNARCVRELFGVALGVLVYMCTYDANDINVHVRAHTLKVIIDCKNNARWVSELFECGPRSAGVYVYVRRQ